MARLSFVYLLSALRDRSGGADPGTGAALNAGGGIDLILRVTLRNRRDRASVGTGAAAYASVADDIGHWFYTSQLLKLKSLYHTFFKFQC